MAVSRLAVKTREEAAAAGVRCVTKQTVATPGVQVAPPLAERGWRRQVINLTSPRAVAGGARVPSPYGRARLVRFDRFRTVRYVLREEKRRKRIAETGLSATYGYSG